MNPSDVLHNSSLLLEYAAFVKLRVSKPNLERPYRIPLSTVGCCFLLVPPFVVTIVVMLLASFASYAYAIGTIAVAIILYVLRGRQSGNPSYSRVEEEDVEIGEEEVDIPIS